MYIVHQVMLVNKSLLLLGQIQVTHVHCTSSHVANQIFTIARSNTGNSCTSSHVGKQIFTIARLNTGNSCTSSHAGKQTFTIAWSNTGNSCI